MPKDDHEPESYSVEEMLERLREGEREKESASTGELVTRADGTQAVRVRKRKRRTNQPEKKSELAAKKRRRPVALLVGSFLLLVIGFGVALVVLLGRYNSAGFRSGLEEQVVQRSGGTVVLDGLVVTPVAARARSLKVDWGEGKTLGTLALSSIAAELSMGSFLSGDWKNEAVVAQSGELLLPGTASLGEGARGGGQPMLFSEVRCEFMNIDLGPKGKGSHFKNVELSLRKGPDGGSQLLWSGGDARWAGWAPLEVDRGMAEVSEGGLKLVSLRMRPENGQGEVNFVGSKLLRAGQDVELAVSMDSFPLEAVLGDSLGDILQASVSSQEGTLVLDGSSLGESELRLSFDGKEAVLQNLPFLHILHTRLGDTEFVRPRFREIKGVFLRDRSGIRLQDLELVSPYQLVVRGFLEVDPEGSLSGRFDVGVSEGKIMTSTNRKRSTVFSDPREGYCWVTISLGGTVDEPIDDLQGLLQQAAREAAARDKAPVEGPRDDGE